ncbi:MAG: hypothetical protein ACFCUO_11150 [Rhodospirillales bacterium]
MNDFAHPRSACRRRTQGADAAGGGDDAVEAILQAGLHYVACDLRELAKLASPVRRGELLALCRLIEAMTAG